VTSHTRIPRENYGTVTTTATGSIMEQLIRIVNIPLFTALAGYLETTSQSNRKNLLLLARYMGLPKDDTGNMMRNTHQTISDVINYLINSSQVSAYYNIRSELSWWQKLDDFLSHRIHAGGLIMACCISPYSEDKVIQEIQIESYMKEIRVMDRRGYLSDLSFAPIFGDHHKPMHEIDIPPNIDMAIHIKTAIDNTCSRYEGSVQMSRLSNKLLPSRTLSSLKRKYPDIAELDGKGTPVVLEELKRRKRIRLSGPVEMKQRWYSNGVAPRTYYVSGESAFEGSRFLQDFFNDLCDSLEVTNRRTRVRANRILLRARKHALFYDLTSFTSNLAIQKVFLRDLANYTRDITLNTMSWSDGPVERRLGDMIDEYIETVNDFPEWYSDKLNESGFHGPAGFLGVFGNIASCTFIHGVVLLMLCEEESETGCAGDDAVILTHNDSMIFSAVQRLGVLAIEKTYTSDSDAIYLKRRTFEHPHLHTLSQWRYMQFPSLVMFFDKKYDRFREQTYTKSERLRLCISSLLSTFDSLIGFPSEDLDLARSVLEGYYDLHKLPWYGNVPQFRENPDEQPHFVPSLVHIGSSRFVELTIEDCFRGFGYVPEKESFDMGISLRLRKGLFFKVWGRDPLVRLYERLGYVRKVWNGPRARIEGKEGLRIVKELYGTRFSRSSSTYTYYECIDQLPQDALGGEYNQEIDGLVCDPDDM